MLITFDNDSNEGNCRVLITYDNDSNEGNCRVLITFDNDSNEGNCRVLITFDNDSNEVNGRVLTRKQYEKSQQMNANKMQRFQLQLNNNNLIMEPSPGRGKVPARC